MSMTLIAFLYDNLRRSKRSRYFWYIVDEKVQVRFVSVGVGPEFLARQIFHEFLGLFALPKISNRSIKAKTLWCSFELCFN